MNKNIAELVGMFVLVFGGCAVLAGDKVGNIGVALASGISLLAMAYAIGPISGCHINCRGLPPTATGCIRPRATACWRRS